MQITRIQHIRNHRIFRDFSWPASGLADFKRFNLVYGWNGAGKTTLSNLFRHLQDKKAIGEGEVKFTLENSEVDQSEIPSAAIPQVRVFNRDTVDRLIFEVPGKELPPVYFLGEDSVEKQKEIERLKLKCLQMAEETGRLESASKDAARDLESFCTEQARSIKNLLTVSGGGPYNNYNITSFKKAADELVDCENIERLSLEQRERYLSTKEGAAKPHISLRPASYPDFSTLTKRVQAVLERSVVASAIAQLVEDPVLANWVGLGLDLHLGDPSSALCKFCDQPISRHRLQLLESHFNDQLRSFQAEVEALISEVEMAREFINSVSKFMPAKELFYSHLVPKYEKAVETLSLQSALVGLHIDALRRSLNAKANSPFQKLDIYLFLIGPGDPVTQAGKLETFFQVMIAAGSAYGMAIGRTAYENAISVVNDHNDYSTNFAAEVECARKALESDDVAGAIGEYKVKNKTIKDCAESLDEARKSVRNTNDIISNLDKTIKHHMPAADQLNNDMTSYLGRSEICFIASETGYFIARNGKPALHLSEGERTAIAFMYFLKSLEDKDFDISNGVVVIDDPVSSLDSNALYCAFGFMKARVAAAGQVFILTHNFVFFRLVKNWFNSRNKDKTMRDAKLFMLKSLLVNGNRQGSLCALDKLLHEHESEYHYLFQSVLNGSQQSAGDELADFYALPNMARRLLESVLSFKRPEKAGELHRKLSDIPDFDEAKKARIIRFVHTYSHHGFIAEPEHDLSVLHEAPAVLRDVLDLIQHLDPDHFNRMSALSSEGAE